MKTIAQHSHTRENNSSPLAYWGRGLSISEVAALVGVSINTIRNWTNTDSRFHLSTFPKPSRIGPRMLRWSETEVVEYLHATQAKGGKAR